mgnify:CR=1 FL=1
MHRGREGSGIDDRRPQRSAMHRLWNFQRDLAPAEEMAVAHDGADTRSRVDGGAAVAPELLAVALVDRRRVAVRVHRSEGVSHLVAIASMSQTCAACERVLKIRQPPLDVPDDGVGAPSARQFVPEVAFAQGPDPRTPPRWACRSGRRRSSATRPRRGRASSRRLRRVTREASWPPTGPPWRSRRAGNPPGAGSSGRASRSPTPRRARWRCSCARRSRSRRGGRVRNRCRRRSWP